MWFILGFIGSHRMNAFMLNWLFNKEDYHLATTFNVTSWNIIWQFGCILIEIDDFAHFHQSYWILVHTISFKGYISIIFCVVCYNFSIHSNYTNNFPLLLVVPVLTAYNFYVIISDIDLNVRRQAVIIEVEIASKLMLWFNWRTFFYFFYTYSIHITFDNYFIWFITESNKSFLFTGWMGGSHWELHRTK